MEFEKTDNIKNSVNIIFNDLGNLIRKINPKKIIGLDIHEEHKYIRASKKISGKSYSLTDELKDYTIETFRIGLRNLPLFGASVSYFYPGEYGTDLAKALLPSVPLWFLLDNFVSKNVSQLYDESICEDLFGYFKSYHKECNQEKDEKIDMSLERDYKIMGVESDCNLKQLKKIYRKKAMNSHPDIFKGNKVKEKEFIDINIAYERIKTKIEKKNIL